MSITLVNSLNRHSLVEGRHTGVAFGFCRKTGEGSFETITPISPCKDYLNDVIYTEATGKSFEAYGMRYVKRGLWKEGFAYIAIAIVPDRFGQKASNHSKKVAQLKRCLEQGRKCLINRFELLLKVDGRTSFFMVDDETIIAQVPLYWTKYMYLISLWSLLTRIGFEYETGGVLTLLKSKKFEDAMLIKGVLPKLQRLIKGEYPVQEMPAEPDTYNVHNCGIYTFPFPPTKTNK